MAQTQGEGKTRRMGDTETGRRGDAGTTRRGTLRPCVGRSRGEGGGVLNSDKATPKDAFV
jgi:hypothetical protein